MTAAPTTIVRAPSVLYGAKADIRARGFNSPRGANDAPHARTRNYTLRPERDERAFRTMPTRPVLDFDRWQVPAQQSVSTPMSDELAPPDVDSDDAVHDDLATPPGDQRHSMSAGPEVPLHDITTDLRGASRWWLGALVGAIAGVGALVAVVLMS